MGLHIKDIALLKLIQAYFGGVGNILEYKKKEFAEYRVSSMEQLISVISPHFDKYPLITQKQADYLLFIKGVLIKNQKEHLTEAGLRKILAIKASMNKGLSTVLKTAFPDIIPIARPLVVDQIIKDPQ